MEHYTKAYAQVLRNVRSTQPELFRYAVLSSHYVYRGPHVHRTSSMSASSSPAGSSSDLRGAQAMHDGLPQPPDFSAAFNSSSGEVKKPFRGRYV
jgi:hypothetical protein